MIRPEDEAPDLARLDEICDAAERAFRTVLQLRDEALRSRGLPPRGWPRTGAATPIVSSQAAIANFLGRCPNTTGLIATLQAEGTLTFDRVSRNKFRVTFTDPAQHAEALARLAPAPKQPRKRRKRITS
jgi:hypothetical protein